MKLLYLSGVWPEPGSSAAGTRVMDLCRACLAVGWDLCFAATAAQNEHSADLTGIGIRTQPVELNNSSFDTFIQAEQPDIVLFDRFMLEEQFAMRVAEHCPDAMRVLDTSDLHFLRRARQLAFEKQMPLNLFTDDMRRELASIFRCDLSLLISDYEYDLLQQQFQVPDSLLHWCPFIVNQSTVQESHVGFDARRHFMHIGNFLHPPNVDSVQFLRHEIWPLIRKQIPDAECHIYGAYAKETHLQLANEKQGFYLKGRCEDAIRCCESYRVSLVPLRYGAGIKGKIADAWMAGTPTVTTAIGAEGMFKQESLPESAEAIAAAAIKLYQEQSMWQQEQALGYQRLRALCVEPDHADGLINRLRSIHASLGQHRQDNVIGSILQLQNMKSTYYMSKWIEEKNK